MILVDANIPMYLIGAAHPNRDCAALHVERAIASGERLVTDAEVFQELLYRYVAIGRLEAIQPAFAALLSLVDETLPIELADGHTAKEIVFGGYRLSARDALHVAVMQRHQMNVIMSFDRGSDRYPGLIRLG
jgi:uncharacterized protein